MQNDGAQFLKGPVILPVPNPTGNPYISKGHNEKSLMQKIKDVNELKGLQVKAELNKLADPSPAFAQLLLMENRPEDDQGEQMQDSEIILGDKRPSLSEIFHRIQGARPSVH